MHFDAAHRLHNSALSDEKNRELYGGCNNEHGHGHNYILEIYLKGAIHPKTGYLMDLSKLKDIVDKEIVQECDHKHLNLDVPWLEGINPTAENLVVAFWKRLKNKIDEGKLYKLRLYETERNIVEYMGE